MARRRDAWVFLRGRTETSAIGAQIELVEARVRRRAGTDGTAGGGYAWAVFPETAHGDYSVNVIYPSGLHHSGRLSVSDAAHSIVLDEPSSI